MLYSKLIINILNIFDYFQQIKIIKLINSRFSKPIVIFDVGAHYGETIKLFTNKLKVEKIYSFEASPENFNILKKNISNNDYPKVEILNYGLGEKNTKVNLNQTLESSSSTINQLNKKSKYFKKKLKVLNIKDNDSFHYQLPVTLITMDDFIEKNHIKYVDLLKIDTEGYEYNILKGLSKYHKRVKLVYFEHHYDDMILKNYKFGDIHKLLKNFGFVMIKKIKMKFRKSFEYVYENQIDLMK